MPMIGAEIATSADDGESETASLSAFKGEPTSVVVSAEGLLTILAAEDVVESGLAGCKRDRKFPI